jgi:hypothetical protein
MHEITLICTIHQEEGACTLDELHRIIEAINPDTIFEEIPPSTFDEYYRDGTRSSLETRTIEKYLECHRADLIPVDHRYEPPHFFENQGQMHRRVARISIVDARAPVTLSFANQSTRMPRSRFRCRFAEPDNA